MLILTRRVGETLMIGDQVSVTVLGVKGNQVRIGVNAPKKYLCTVKKSTNVFNTNVPCMNTFNILIKTISLHLKMIISLKTILIVKNILLLMIKAAYKPL